MVDPQHSSPVIGVERSDATARVGALFDEAATFDTRDPRGIERDRDAVEMLHESLATDVLLEQIDLGQLAGLLDRCVVRLDSDEKDRALRQLAWSALDLVRRPTVVRRIQAEDRASWEQRTLAAIERSHFTVGPLFRQRVSVYGAKVLFAVAERGTEKNLTWRDVEARVDTLARGLLSLGGTTSDGSVDRR
jgi:hypothetical protein